MQPEETKPKKAKRKPPAPSLMPHDCAVLAVDPGATSGWAIYVRGRLVAYGKLTEKELYADGPANVLRLLLSQNGPHVVVLERPFRIRFQNQATIGAAMKMWAQRAKEGRFVRHILRVYPPTWRRILPKGMPKDRKAVRAQEAALAGRMLGKDKVHPDIAPAVLMGRWASFAGEVRELLQEAA